MTSQIVPRPPDMTFDHFAKVRLDVAGIEVRNDYRPPMEAPHVEHLFLPPPYVAAEKLVKIQLIAAGGSRVLRVIIREASVVREELPINKGVDNVFLREAAERLRAKVVLRFELVDPLDPAVIIGHADVTARRVKTLLEGASVADRERAYFELTEGLVTKLSHGLTTVVKNTFGANKAPQ